MERSATRTALAAGGAIGGALLAWRAWKQNDLRRKNREIQGRQQIVIIGAGFAGVNVAQELTRLLGAGPEVRITLVDQNNFLLFTPMLSEVAGGELDARHVVASPRRLSPRIRFEQGKVESIDLANRSVVLRIGADGSDTRTLTADHLVIAVGSVPDYRGIPGLKEHSLGMKSIHDAASIRTRILDLLERANLEDDAGLRKQLLTFVVGGGGYTGVETMAAINDLVRSVAREYPNIRPEEITTIIVEPGERLLSELSADLAAYAQQKLQEHGVQVRLKTKIASAGDDYVDVQPGARLQTRTLIWAGGITPNPLVAKLDCKRGHHGGIIVDECCRVADRAGVWALGDCAEVPKWGSKGTYAPTAQNATREGTTVARNIVSALRREPAHPFRFQPIGELALVGRHSGVAKLYGRHFSGLMAWAMWRAIYLSKMPGMAQRSRIAIDWLLDAIFGRELAEVPAAALASSSNANR
jgi:NADH dehydrogenase